MVTVIEDEDASAVECVWEYYDKERLCYEQILFFIWDD